MLDRLDSVDWSALQPPGMSRSAADIPIWVRNLLSDDPETRLVARKELHILIADQGIVYQPAAPLIPFLLELLVDEHTPDKALVLELISAVVGLVHPDEQGEHAQRAWDAYGVASKGLNVYLELLTDPDAEVRFQASELLSLLPEYAATSIPAIFNVLDREARTMRRAYLIRAIRKLCTDNPHVPADIQSQVVSRLERLMNAAVKVVQLVAAASLAKMQRDQVLSRAVELLTDQLSHPESYPERVWPGGLLVGGLSMALRGTGQEKGVPALSEAFTKIPKIKDALTVAMALLDLAFDQDRMITHQFPLYDPGQDPPTFMMYYPGGKISLDQVQPDSLSKYQRIALEAILQRQDFWQVDTDLLSLYGLPGTKEELQQLLECQ